MPGHMRFPAERRTCVSHTYDATLKYLVALQPSAWLKIAGLPTDAGEVLEDAEVQDLLSADLSARSRSPGNYGPGSAPQQERNPLPGFLLHRCTYLGSTSRRCTG